MFKLGGFGAGGSEASMGIPRSAVTAVWLCYLWKKRNKAKKKEHNKSTMVKNSIK